MARRHRPFAAPLLAAAFAATLVAGCGGDGADTLNAGADSAETAWNTPVTIDVLANDEASDGTVSVAAVGKPDHGTAEMVDGRLVYTPEPGWFGVETFSYTARGAGISAPATVKVAVQARMTLTGTVADAPLPQAPVTVAVGAGSFTTTTDADGRYRVAVTADAQSDVVRIEAAGTGAQSAVRLVSYPGTAGAVAAAVDASGVVDSARAAGLNLSHLSTAIAALMSRGEGGGPKTGAALDVALATVEADPVIVLATLLRQVIDQGQPLPEGQADTWSFALDATAARAMRDQLMASGQWWDAASATLDEAPALPYVGPTTGEATLVLHGDSQQGELWLLRADHGGTASAPDGSRALTWQVQEGGDLAVTYTTPWAAGTQQVLDTQSGAYVAARIDVTGVRLRLLGDGRLGAFSLLQSTTITEGTRSGEVVQASQPTPWQPTNLATALDAYPVASAELATGARWAGAVLRTPGGRYDGFGADVMQVVSATQAKLELAGVQRSLSVADGRFTLQDEAGADWRYTRLRPAAADGLEKWLVQGRLGTPQGWAAVLPMAPLAKPYTPVVADLARDWRYPSDGLYTPDGVVLQADGTATVWSGTASWSLQPGGELRVVRSNPGGYNYDYVLQWWPLALADGRLIVLANEQYPSTGEQVASDAAVTRYRWLQAFQAAPAAP